MYPHRKFLRMIRYRLFEILSALFTGALFIFIVPDCLTNHNLCDMFYASKFFLPADLNEVFLKIRDMTYIFVIFMENLHE